MMYKNTDEIRKYNRERVKRWRRENPEKAKKLYDRADKKRKNSNGRKEWQKNYIQTHRQKRAEYMKEWRKNNPEYWKLWFRKNRKKTRIYEKVYRLKHPGYIKRKNIKRYTRRQKAEGSFTLEEWENKKKEYNYCCAKCGVSEEELLNKTNEGLTIDHIIPLSKGGTNYISNIRPLCRSCNARKGNNIEANLNTVIDSKRNTKMKS